MRNHRSRAFLPLLAFSTLYLAGCTSSTQPPSTKLSDYLQLSNGSGFVILDAGGYQLQGKDTTTYFDALPAATVTNISASTIDVTIRWQFGTLQNGVFVPDLTIANGVVPDHDRSYISVSGHQSVNTNFVSAPVLLGVHNSLRGRTIAYQMSVNSSGLNSIMFTDTLHIPFETRWRGYEFTTEQSPDSLTTYDAPDDSDWQLRGSVQAKLFPAYPNPTDRFTSLQFDLNTGGDTVTSSLWLTPLHKMMTVFTGETLPAGTHQVQADLDSIPPGFYRLISHINNGSLVGVGHGDIMKMPF